MATIYQVGDAVPVVCACGHDLTVEHVIIPAALRLDGAMDTARYYALLCFYPGCERRYGWRGDEDIPHPLGR